MGKIYYNEKVYAGGGTDPTWGNITGTLSNQTDLQNALNDKQDTLTEGDGIDIDSSDRISLDISYLTGSRLGLGTAAYKDVPTSGNASNSQVVMGNDSRLTDSRNAKDVSAWAKASTKPSYTANEVGAISTTEKGANGGVATLGNDGKVPSAQLPMAGHDMIPVANDIDTIAALTDGDDNYVINAYTAQRWSNVDVITLFTTVTKGKDTVGKWEDNWKTTGDYTGWLWHSALYDVVDNDDIEISFVFGVGTEEAVSVYAYRIDDEVYNAVTSPTGNPQEQGWYESDGLTPPTYTLTTDTSVQIGKTYYAVGGAIAFKLNTAIKNASGVKIGIKLKHQRTQVDNLIVLS